MPMLPGGRAFLPPPPLWEIAMTARRRVCGTLPLLILLLHLPRLAAAETVPDASAVVERLHSALIDVMRNATALGYDGRHEKLSPILTELFDIAYMAEKSVGRYWKTANEAERSQLVATFTRFTIANYAGRFDGYSGQHFETLEVEPSLHGTVLVHSRLIEEGAEPVQLNYRLANGSGKWRIIDVYLNGTVSEIALRRSEYSSLIARSGFEALLAALDAKIADLASPTTPADQS
jgi:phospholipid transport system substrate-binding protein